MWAINQKSEQSFATMQLTAHPNTTTTSLVSPTSTASGIALLCADPLRMSSQSDNNSENFVALVYPSLSLVDCEQALNSSAINSIAPGFPSELRSTATVVCALVMTLGIVGNVLVPLVVCRTKDMCNSTNLFLINLSIADLLVIIVCMPTVLIELHSRPEVWILGEAMCKAVPFVELVVAHGSILTMLAISFERYYAICKPLKAGYKCTIRRALVIIVVVWSVAFVATIPVLFGTELSQARYIDGSLVSVCLTKANTDWQKVYFLGSMTAFFWGPLCVLLVIYSVIAKRLVVDDRIQSNGTDGRIASNTNADNVQMRARRQVVLMLAAVVTCFFICLLPFRLLTLWLIIASEEQIKSMSMEVFYNLLYFCRILLYVNSMLNPCLYAVVSSKFREAFVVVLCCHNRNRQLIRHSTFNTTTSSVATTSSKSSLHRSANGNNCVPLIDKNIDNKNSSETPLISCTSLRNPLFEPRICEINDQNLNSFLRELNENDIRIKCQRFDSPYNILRAMSSHESYV